MHHATKAVGALLHTQMGTAARTKEAHHAQESATHAARKATGRVRRQSMEGGPAELPGTCRCIARGAGGVQGGPASRSPRQRPQCAPVSTHQHHASTTSASDGRFATENPQTRLSRPPSKMAAPRSHHHSATKGRQAKYCAPPSPPRASVWGIHAPQVRLATQS